jgi:hypothetical protein
MMEMETQIAEQPVDADSSWEAASLRTIMEYGGNARQDEASRQMLRRIRGAIADWGDQIQTGENGDGRTHLYSADAEGRRIKVVEVQFLPNQGVSLEFRGDGEAPFLDAQRRFSAAVFASRTTDAP